jgi:lactoylglutathione lyase
MSHAFNHVHIKANNPEEVANWYVKAFDFEILDNSTRDLGDQFVRCQTNDGVRINISSARTNETLPELGPGIHLGIEHFGIEVDNMQTELTRLQNLGATLLEGPNVNSATGMSIAFIGTPDGSRIEVMEMPKG